MRFRKIQAACAALAMALSLGTVAHADELQGAEGWKVRFTPENGMESNFNTADMDEAVAGMQPGDAITFHVAVENGNPARTEWYMSNKTLYSLEDRSRNGATAGGAYEYRLVYVDPSGAETVLFDSDTVGGENVSAAGEGLHEATDALEDYFYMDTLSDGQQGHVYLRVELDGETQGNDYQDTLADLQLNFAVTLLSDEPDEPDKPDKPKDWVVKTGDDTDLGKMYLVMAASGIAFLGLAAWGISDRRKAKKGGSK